MSDSYLEQLAKSANWAGTYLSGDGTPRPWVSEAMLNKIAPFLEGVENAHLRATQIVSALAEDKTSMATAWRELRVGDWFFHDSPECTYRYSVAERTDGGWTVVCSSNWHHDKAKADMQSIAKLHNAALTSGDGSESAGLRRSLTELAAKWRREARGDAGIEECAYELGATIASHPSGHSTTSWKCAARSANTGANDPQDCDWPFCGCDPHAEKVIEIMIESGWSKPALAPAISRPPTQGVEPLKHSDYCPVQHKNSSLPPSRADLGGDRVSKLVGRWRNLAELNNTKGEHGSLVAEAQMKCAEQLETAVAEGQQSSELVGKTPSASPGERERLSPEMILKADRETGSTHMTDQQKWGELMAEKLNAALAGNERETK